MDEILLERIEHLNKEHENIFAFGAKCLALCERYGKVHIGKMQSKGKQLFTFFGDISINIVTANDYILLLNHTGEVAIAKLTNERRHWWEVKWDLILSKQTIAQFNDNWVHHLEGIYSLLEIIADEYQLLVEEKKKHSEKIEEIENILKELEF